MYPTADSQLDAPRPHPSIAKSYNDFKKQSLAYKYLFFIK